MCYNSHILIGNSSVGIRESSYMGINVINIGDRQKGRERGKNIIDVDYNSFEIEKAAKKYLSKKRVFKKNNLYGTGSAGKKF